MAQVVVVAQVLLVQMELRVLVVEMAVWVFPLQFQVQL
jgi:hypothetical protein